MGDGMLPLTEFARLKQLVELVAASPINELDVTEGACRVRIVKAAPSQAAPLPTLDAPAAPVPVPAGIVRAPMAGTFYAAPSPADPPFVRPGELVARGAALGIIEAMKTMNRVLADRDGTVRAVLAVDGAVVEFDQPLFEIS